MVVSNPKVTVLMPVYNGEKYLYQAIESILSQTFVDFEFLIIDDGSRDRSVDIINSYDHPAIRLERNEANLGLVVTLNKGLRIARGIYIARMDCDDISLPERLAKQVEFMDTHPEVGVCGTWVKTIGDLRERIWNHPPDDSTIRSRFIFDSALAHPSVMLRKKLFVEADLYYSECFQRAQDYDLWVRASKHTLLANIPEVLVLYRIHPEQIGRRQSEEQRTSMRYINQRQIESLGLRLTSEEMTLHQALGLSQFQAMKEFILKSEAWLSKLQKANQSCSLYPEPAFSKVLGERWFMACYNTTGLGLWVWKIFWQSSLSSYIDLDWKWKFKFGVKCGLKYRRSLMRWFGG